ncbi:Rad21/Rec8 N terminal domain protein [Aspergillus lucknowensis]|uniref:Rec8 like protein-domain-containing protein n=1 Tax=Aspergillus lucknowensis TaxID=176173 RepID=A0ABR4M4F1_9EURO
MFYSHETWGSHGLVYRHLRAESPSCLVVSSNEFLLSRLVATLGARSVSRRLNRKTILDVDVPKACGVIMDPVAPMALRLQSNLLYGVSRVYSQQCGYTLLDAQAMHDRMRAMLRSVPAGGLDPSAGKARPDQLVLPYDPSFLPENNLPGLAIDLSKLNRLLVADGSQQSSVFLPRTPDLSQSAPSNSSSLRLNIPSDDNILRAMGGFSSEADIASSVQGGPDFKRLAATSVNEDGGVLLQPDFEFDEDGNIIELGARQQSEAKAPILADVDIEMAITDGQTRPAPQAMPSVCFGVPAAEAENADDRDEVIMRQRYRAPKILPSDGETVLRGSDLSQMNDNYIRNMATATRQKRHNRLTTQAKKNAAYWVFGMGIGCVGTGVGAARVLHPLHSFSGRELYESLVSSNTGHKRSREDDELSEGRRVRARDEEDEHMGMAGPLDDNNLWNQVSIILCLFPPLSRNRALMSQDVELGRHASPPLHDDNSSQMPWNITASIQSSRHETSAANIFRGFGSVSDFSSRGIPESASWFARDPGAGISGIGRARNRLTSASPLAGRGFPYNIDSLLIPGYGDDDLNKLEGFNLTEYLEDNPVGDSNSIVEAGGPSYISQPALQNSLSESVMDQEGLNFLDFLAAKISSLNLARDEAGEAPSAGNEITFSILLHPNKTSRAVATQGLMHILALTTKGFLSIRQSAYVDQSSEEHGVRYEYGEISIRLVDM